MGLADVENRIKKTDLENIRVSDRVEKKILEKNPGGPDNKKIDADLVKRHLKDEEYKGIIEQEENQYAIVTYLDSTYDLITIVRLDSEGKHVNIKTAFPQNRARRFKRGWR